MFCTNCGASNKDSARFCINCAESLSDVQTEQRPLRPRVLKDDSYFKKVLFLRPLFDFSFHQFVTPRMMGVLYGLSILSGGLAAFLFVLVGFNVSRLFGIFALFIVAPLIFLLTVIYSRVLLEMALAILRMSNHMANIEMTGISSPNTEEKSESRESIQWNL